MLTAAIVLTGVILIGCKKKKIDNNKNKFITVEFGFKNKFDKNTIDFFNINYNFENPFLSQSEDLIVIEAINEETKLNSYIITKKETEDNFKQFSIRRGYWFDGYGCFIYGEIITGENGNEIFIPADSATQSTMNACGYENVC